MIIEFVNNRSMLNVNVLGEDKKDIYKQRIQRFKLFGNNVYVRYRRKSLSRNGLENTL